MSTKSIEKKIEEARDRLENTAGAMFYVSAKIRTPHKDAFLDDSTERREYLNK